MKILNIPRFRGGSTSKVNGIYTSSTRSMKGCGKQAYADKLPSEMLGDVAKRNENVSVVPVQPAKSLDMSRIAQVLAETSISKRGNRKVRL
jgi:hypothetical protein